ncbi:16S rRNA (guanine966-N2)-methyltransferase [Humitalea rosea]|uniref:16S rRNA (Guanine966-N2)-methyltransferase n=1 Tax=Humitalea rosea TaxID=990373 RepID=A0A2W7IJJ5_9PROT|nr:RsmD family RNA methyltransferase [Humitalea rosea]PZW47134.1 16S rRNA (guanine966-N2)-methyltransferase [Humitalea rosea]
MRIISGINRGRILAAPEGDTTRPTADRVRQALFDALTHAAWAGRDRIIGARVLDGFAGTGALGLEALSRGALHATFLETSRPALQALRSNIAVCKAEGATTVIPGDATKPPRASAPVSLIFLDPPYAKLAPVLAPGAEPEPPEAGIVPRTVAALTAAGWIAPGALLVAETARAAEAPVLPGWTLVDERGHGVAMLRVWEGP